MQLELSPQVEQALEKESQSLGISPAELTHQVLAQHAFDWQTRQARLTQEPLKSGRTIEDYIEWMKSRNPNYETQDPYAVDWQAIRAEGRKY